MGWSFYGPRHSIGQASAWVRTDNHISRVDADSVALAAIQALYKLSLEKDSTIRVQGQRIEQLEREVSELRAQLEQLAKN